MSASSRIAEVKLIFRPVDRSNWRTLIALKLKPEQRLFVTPPELTLSRCYVRVFGENFEHLPYLITSGDRAIGYCTTACNPQSDDDYWIDDIMIDTAHQGRGYGRAAVCEAIRMIAAQYPRCRAVQLTCFRENAVAEALYRSLGFLPTGGLDPEFHQPNYILQGTRLDEFRL